MKRTLQFLIFLFLSLTWARGQTNVQTKAPSSGKKVYRWSYDVNADGTVSVADLAVLIQIYNGGTKGQRLLLANDTERYSCDLNNDGTTNKTDINILVDALLRGLKGEYLELLSIEISGSGDASDNRDNGGNLPPLDSKKR